MPQQTSSLHFLFFVLLTLAYFNLGWNLKIASGQVKPLESINKTWCIANPSSSTAELIENLDYACSRVNCSSIQQGSSCFYPNTNLHHASFAMNLYYQQMGRHSLNCNFSNSGLISLSDPSIRSCIYESTGETVYENGNSANQTWETWCVAKPATENDRLQQNINFACNHVDCSPIRDGGSCYIPITLINHASFAMNRYYQTTGRRNTSCDFNGSGVIVTRRPSHGNCTF